MPTRAAAPCLMLALALSFGASASPASALPQVSYDAGLLHVSDGEGSAARFDLPVRLGVLAGSSLDADGTLHVEIEPPCPPSTYLTIKPATLEARYRLSALQARSPRMDGPQDAARLTEALALDPTDAIVRIAVAEALARANRPTEARATLVDGVRLAPVPLLWELSGEPQLAALLAPQPAPAHLHRLAEGFLDCSAWSPAHRWVGFCGDNGDVLVLDASGRVLLDRSLGIDRLIDGQGSVVEGREQAAEAALGRLDRFLSLLGMSPIVPPARTSATSSALSSKVRFPGGTTAMTSGQTIVLRGTAGRLLASRTIATGGAVGLSWGASLAGAKLAVLAWSRRTGSDECPNSSGLAVFDLGARPVRGKP